jgi:acyl carrier protein
LLPAEFEKLLRPYCNAVADGERIDPEAPLWMLGMDSMEIVNLIADIEDEYGLTFPDTMLGWQSLESASALWRSLSELL